MPTRFSRKFRDARGYKEAVRAAETLGLKPDKWWFDGAWVTDNNEPVFLDSVNRVQKVGNKYFYVPVDGNITPVKPSTSRTSGRGTIRVEFTDR